MTESDWNRCTDPAVMLDSLGGGKRHWLTWLRPYWARPSDRKPRLFVVGCCRRIWHLFGDERSRAAIEVAERYVDGLAGEAELKAARKGAAAALEDAEALTRTKRNAGWDECFPAALAKPRVAQARAAFLATVRGEWQAAALAAAEAAAAEPARESLFWELQREMTDAVIKYAEAEGVKAREREWQCTLLRDLFGPLAFRAVRIAPSALAWNDGCIVRLARAAYGERSLPDGTLDRARLAVLADAFEEAGCADEEILRHLRGPGPHVRGCWVVDLLLGKS